MEINEILGKDCFVIGSDVSIDEVELNVKGFNREDFSLFGMDFPIKEIYYSVSKKNTLRGMHFQVPPHSITKLVTCVEGKVFDAIVDLRRQSPDYKKSYTTILSSENRNVLAVREGFAHGYYVLSDTAVMLYLCSGIYYPKEDSGIRWDSCGIEWPEKNPFLSGRDGSFVYLDEFCSPF
jgi:dTDP-4-dehydrorhamnose 3,5-epimerase